MYDYAGERIKKQANTETTLYASNLYEVQRASQTTTRTKYIYANGQRVASVEKEGSERKVRYYHSDHLGGSNVLTDELGNRVQLVEYLPFGETKNNQTTTNYDTTKKFTGKELDDSTGLYYYGARYYAPEIGRFITPDSVIPNYYDPQSLNRYAYCRNNPVKYIDPSGHVFEYVASDAMSPNYHKWMGILGTSDLVYRGPFPGEPGWEALMQNAVWDGTDPGIGLLAASAEVEADTSKEEGKDKGKDKDGDNKKKDEDSNPDDDPREAKWWEWIIYAIERGIYNWYTAPGSPDVGPVPPTDPAWPGLNDPFEEERRRKEA